MMLRWPWKKKPEAGPAPAEELRLARAALERGELTHAAAHVSVALGVNPHDAQARALLEHLSDISPDPLALAPLQEKTYFGVAAVRAYLLARLRRYTEALELLLETIAHKPDVPYLDWACEWLECEDVRGRVDAEPVTRFLMVHSQSLPHLLLGAPGWKTTVDRMPRFIRAGAFRKSR